MFVQYDDAKNEYRERFNPDGECLPVAIDFITYRLHQEEYPKEEVAQISSLYKAAEFFKKKDFNLIIKISWLSLLNPPRLAWYLRNSKNISFGKKFESKRQMLNNHGDDYAALRLISPRSLYNLKGENWKHFVVSYNEGSHDLVYDPLSEILKKEYSESKIQPKSPDYKGMQPAILLW